MLRSEKEALIKELNEKFSGLKAAVVAQVTGIKVSEVTELRAKFREAGVDYKVLKNTLAKRAAQGTPVEQISESFVGPIAIAMSNTDPVAPAKILKDFMKGKESIELKAGIVDGKAINAAQVEQLATLPSLDELRATLLGMINQPATKLLRTIKEPGGALARVLKAREESLS